MMSLNALRVRLGVGNVYKHLFYGTPVSVRNNIRNMFSSKFYSNSNRKSHSNFQKLTGGIRSSVGIVLLLGIWNNEKLWDKVNTEFERIKHIFSLHAASGVVHDTPSPRATYNFLADVVEKTQKSVVYIEITARHPLTNKNIPVSNGSGFIVKTDGLILTNAHVVNHFGYVVVKLYDGREFRGVVEDIDAESDLATVRIDADNLPELPLGCSSDIRPGEFVIAVGNPLTLSHTITAGVVSSANRQGKELGLRHTTDYIQTDAAIHVGNSGGPLVNLDGEVIGINTMKVTEGISFAIPSDRAIKFLKKTEKKKSGHWNFLKTPEKTAEKKKHKFLGLTMLTLSPVVIKDLKERNADFPSVDHGVIVWRVMIGSPSYECGIKPGDVITVVNGIPVTSAETIQKLLETADILHLTVKRGQNTFEISVPLVETVMP